ncbi:MAG: NUDIX hydrolase [Bacteroidetes bacterium]|nr:NUDIX hydrolase [Bacteroidota bacterium]
MRVCGLCIIEDKVLLVKHRGLGPAGIFWAPPGGGIAFGSTATDNLTRECREETGLEVEVGDFLFVHEYLNPPLHALELFFNIEIMGGTLQTGIDPESSPEAQLIQDVSFLSWQEIKKKPAQQLHQILQHSSSPEDLKSKRGYYKFSL